MTATHDTQPVVTAGESLDRARVVMIMAHGRGASASDILEVAKALAVDGFAYLAPQAAGSRWYPQPFNVPLAQNEPWLSAALGRIGSLVEQASESGFTKDKIMLLGFSQGASLSLEFAARNPARYGGVIGLSGSLIGADDEARHDTGSLDGTPVFLGCSDVDPYIPAHRVQRSADQLAALGAQVTLRFYPGMGHLVNADELKTVRAIMEKVRG